MILNATLSLAELKDKASEIRNNLIDYMAKNGGYLKDNLAYVDILLALLVSLKDDYKIILIPEYLSAIYKHLDIAKEEYPFSSDELLSMAFGLALAKEKVVVILDSAYLSDGRILENIFKIAKEKLPLTLIIGDDLSHDLTIKLKNRPLHFYKNHQHENGIRQNILRNINQNKLSSSIYHGLKSAKDNIKRSFDEQNVFTLLGYEYIGPLDGHDINSLLACFKMIHDHQRPMILHCLIKKGQGYEPVEKGLVVMPSLTPPFKKESGLSYKKEVKDYAYMDEMLIHKLDEYLELYADARVFRDRQIAVPQLRDVVYHIALAQLHAADGQVVRRGGRVGVGILADGDVIRGRREV